MSLLLRPLRPVADLLDLTVEIAGAVGGVVGVLLDRRLSAVRAGGR